MELRRFIGPDMRTALRTVREALGPDAVILSNRRVAEGVEITAGPGEDFGVPAQRPVAEAPSATARTVQPARAAPPVSVAAPAAAAREERLAVTAPVGDLHAVRDELRDLRALVEQRLGEMREDRLAWGPGIEGRAWRRLSRSGLPNEVVRELMGAVSPRMSWPDALAALQHGLAGGIACAGDLVAAGGVFAAVGPTGAGKTTTLCKLAVRHALEHGPEGLVLASLDASRLGGPDMLRAVARLLEVPFIGAREGEGPRDLIARAGDARLLLIDSPGLNRRRPVDHALLRELGLCGARSLLVLPANAQLAWIESAVADYRDALPEAAVVTKLDETVSLGEALGVLFRERLPLAYTTDGQEIPGDLQTADPRQLAALALDPEEGDDRRADPSRRGARPAVPQDIAARIA